MSKFIAGIVTYNPDIEQLNKNIQSVLYQVSNVIVFDNASMNIDSIRKLVGNFTDVRLIESSTNKGIAFALNKIMESAGEVEWVLFLDQDSVAPSNMIMEYSKYTSFKDIGIISPVIEDRFNPSETEKGTCVIDTIQKNITSGSFNRVSVWKECGGFDEKLFIDSVDDEYAYRIQKYGYRIIRVNAVVLDHAVGKTTEKKIGLFTLSTYNHSAFRKYYITRNELYVAHEYPEYRSVNNVRLRLLKRKLLVLALEDDKKAKLEAMKKGEEDYKKMVGEESKNPFSRIDRDLIQNGISYLKQHGIKKTIKRLIKYSQDDMAYDAWMRAHQITEEELNKQRNTTFEYNPLISLIVPTYNTPVEMLEITIQSVRDQSYSNWELCIADASDKDGETRKRLKQYEQEDSRIKVKYLDQNLGISGNSNEALKLATGEYCGLYDHDDFLELDTLFEIVKRLQKENYDIFYTDEDKYFETRNTFEYSCFKPDFSIDLLRSHNYITHFFVAKTEILRKVEGFHEEFDGSQDYDIILRCIEQSNRICHIPKVLYHWRVHDGSTAKDPESKMYCYKAGEQALQSHVDRLGIPAKATMLGKPYYGLNHLVYNNIGNKKLSVLVSECSNQEDLKKCLDVLIQAKEYIGEIVIGVQSKNDCATQYQSKYSELISVLKVTGNAPSMRNQLANVVKEDYLLFLDGNVEIESIETIKELLGCISREEVSVVGLKALDEKKHILHAGMILGLNQCIGEPFKGMDDEDVGYMARPMVLSNCSAVSGIAFLTKKEQFQKINGFDESMPTLYDADYCLKADGLIVYNGFAKAIVHHNYQIQQTTEEIENFKKRYSKEMEQGDPFYNSNLSLIKPFETD